MIYIVLFVVFLGFELLYFRIADHFNIIDKPNERSSHSIVTLRGGGIVFYFAALTYFFINGFPFPWFYLGLTLMVIVSFLDDIFTLSNKIRLLIHFSSVVLLTIELGMFSFPWYYLLISFIVIVGVINAYNFMDGINGITVSYSIAIMTLFIIVDAKFDFIDNDLLIYMVLSLLVFGIFNFRRQAKCFAGDVGSVSIAFIILFILGLLIIKSNNLIYILFLSVYGIDTVWTIVNRLLKKENIFKAHRSHLYQYLANEVGFNKLSVAICYGLLQFFIGILIIQFTGASVENQFILAILILLGLSLIYLVLKKYIVKRYVVH